MSELGDLYDGMIPGAEPWADMVEREAIVKSIRKALRFMAEKIANETPLYSAAEWLADDDVGLAPSVVAWVLEGEQ